MGSLIRRKPAPRPVAPPTPPAMSAPANSADVPSRPPNELPPVSVGPTPTIGPGTTATPAATVTPADVNYGSGAQATSTKAKRRRNTGSIATSAQGVMGNAPVSRKSLLGS